MATQKLCLYKKYKSVQENLQCLCNFTQRSDEKCKVEAGGGENCFGGGGWWCGVSGKSDRERVMLL